MKRQKHTATALRKFFSDKHGKLVLWQWPNVPIVIWAVARLLQWPLTGTAEQWAWVIGTAAILYWAILEIFDGATTFRRTLGVLVVLLVLLG